MMLVAGCRCSNKNTLNNLGEFTHDVQCATMHVLCEIYLLGQCIVRCPAAQCIMLWQTRHNVPHPV